MGRRKNANSFLHREAEDPKRCQLQHLIKQSKHIRYHILWPYLQIIHKRSFTDDPIINFYGKLMNWQLESEQKKIPTRTTQNAVVPSNFDRKAEITNILSHGSGKNYEN
jgi:hypothetical protein